jgi:urocanate hydratase
MADPIPFPPESAPSGGDLSCAGWSIEAPLRLLCNTVTKAVAHHPDGVVLGDTRRAGAAVRDAAAFTATTDTLRELGPSETLIMRGGAPAGVVRSNLLSPRVLVVDTPGDDIRTAPDRFAPTDAGVGPSWLYTGVSTGLATAWEAWRSVAQTHFAGSLERRVIIAIGVTGFGPAFVRAAMLQGGVVITVLRDALWLDRLQALGIVSERAESIDAAMTRAQDAPAGSAIGVADGITEALAAIDGREPELSAVVDLGDGASHLLDHWTKEEADNLRTEGPQAFASRSIERAEERVAAMRKVAEADVLTMVRNAGLLNTTRVKPEDTPVVPMVPKYLEQRLGAGFASLKFVALSGDTADLAQVDAVLREAAGSDETTTAYLDKVSAIDTHQGLPTREIWLPVEKLREAAAQINHLARYDEVTAPIAVCTDATSPQLAPYPLVASHKPGVDDGDWAMVAGLLASAAGLNLVALTQSPGGRPTRVGAMVAAQGSPEAETRLSALVDLVAASGFTRLRLEGRDGTDDLAARLPMAFCADPPAGDQSAG